MLKVFEFFCLLSCPFGHSGGSSWSTIVNGWRIVFFSSREELDCWVSTHSKLSSWFFILSRVHLGDFDLAFKIGGEFSPLWSQSFAVTTPGSIELHKPSGLITIDILFKNSICQDNDVFFVRSSWRLMGLMRMRVSAWSSSKSFISDLSFVLGTFRYLLMIKLTIPYAVRSPE